jgi:hypothetical protein
MFPYDIASSSAPREELLEVWGFGDLKAAAISAMCIGRHRNW